MTEINPETGVRWRHGDKHPTEDLRFYGFHPYTKDRMIWKPEAYVVRRRRERNALKRLHRLDPTKGPVLRFKATAQKRKRSAILKSLGIPRKRKKKLRNYTFPCYVVSREKRRLYSLYRFKELARYAIRTQMKSRVIPGARAFHGCLSASIGCTNTELRHHIENQFSPGMSWDNYGLWQVDHKIPLWVALSFSDVFRLNHFSNLQPLWQLDNIRKSNCLS